MKRAKGLIKLVAVSTLVFSLSLSTQVLAASSYGTQQWYLNYMQQFSSSRVAPTQPVPTQPAPTQPTPPTKPAPTPPSQTPPPPVTNPAPPVYSTPSSGQYSNDWYLNYLRQYQSSSPYYPAPTQPVPGAQPAPPTTADPTPTNPPSEQPVELPSSLTAAEKQLVGYINDHRTQNGAGAVTVDPELVRIARIRAEKMAEMGGIEHNLPGYGTAGQQLTREGYKYAYMGENLAASSDVYKAHAQLVHSSAHNEIMLEPKFTKIGVAVVNFKNRPGIVVVEIFVQPY